MFSDNLIGIYGVIVYPPFNCTTFEGNTSQFTFNCTGVGDFLFWIVDGNDSTSAEISQRGIQTIALPRNAGNVSSRLLISTSAVNNNTKVVCKVFDYMRTNIQYSPPLYLRLQGKSIQVDRKYDYLKCCLFFFLRYT